MMTILGEQKLREKQFEVRFKIEQHAIKEALDIWSRSKYKSTFLFLHQKMDGDPEEKFNYCLTKAKKQ